MWDEIVAYYNEAVFVRADPRTKDWLLVESPWGPISFAICYLIFCTNARKITAGIPAYKMRPLIILYNFIMVLLSIYMTYEFFISAYLEGYNLICQPVDYTNNQLSIRMAKVCWWYFFSKYIELLETVFFALRKKYNQISVLHVYHHTSMLIIWWFGIKYVPGGQSFLFGLINSFVHAVMYTYYGLSAIGPHMQKYLWWKKYLTILQLSQFFTLMVHTVNNLAIKCDFPAWLNQMLFCYAISLAVLFLNFYVRNYNKSSVTKSPSSSNGHALNGKASNGTANTAKSLKHD